MYLFYVGPGFAFILHEFAPCVPIIHHVRAKLCSAERSSDCITLLASTYNTVISTIHVGFTQAGVVIASCSYAFIHHSE